MTDIVDRLRDLAMYISVQNEKDGALIREAADEIVRLRGFHVSASGGGSSFADIKRDLKS